MRKIYKHTFNMLSSFELDEIIRIKYVVDYKSRQGVSGLNGIEGNVWLYHHKILKDEVNLKEVKDYLKDPNRYAPSPFDFIAYLIKKKVIPKGDYILEFE